MEIKDNFTKMTLAEFETYISSLRVARTVTLVQQHHTYSPSYSHFKNNNHFQLQVNMKNDHVVHNGWADIGQHFTTFPDGTIMTGRSIESSPACIYMNNAHSVCIENLGNFDVGGDDMTMIQKETIVKMTAMLCEKFRLPVNTDRIVYHHWFDLSTGERNNGTKNNKSCPGTNFFGGNKVTDATIGFIPLVYAALQVTAPVMPILNYVCVTADALNVRVGPDAESDLAPNREPAQLGSVLRVYEENNGWFRISSSEQHWVNGAHTIKVMRKEVKADLLNIRSGPALSHTVVNKLQKGTEVFVFEQTDGWYKIGFQDWWAKKDFVA